MKTASFFTYEGPGRISIARFAPRRLPKGYRVASELAPGKWFKSVDRAEYERRYAAQLAELDPAATAARLRGLAAGAEPVLLCWEEPPFGPDHWCHRHLAAAWLTEHTGLAIPEFEPPEWRKRKRSGDCAILDDGDCRYHAAIEPWMTDRYMAREFAGTHEYDLSGSETLDARLELRRGAGVVSGGILRFVADGSWAYTPGLQAL